MNPETLVAIYAAVVATGALFLEVRRWVESGLGVHVSASPNMTMVGGAGKTDEGYLLVKAYNRGEVPTTVTMLAILEFPNIFSLWRMKWKRSFIIPRPAPSGAGPGLPGDLPTGGQWMGVALPKASDFDFATGKFYAAVYTTGSDRPFLGHIKLPSTNKPQAQAQDSKSSPASS